MKKVQFKIVFVAFCVAIIIAACEKEDMVMNPENSVSEQDPIDLTLLVKSDSAGITNPEVFSADDLSAADVNHEAVKYLYDKSGRLVLISYFYRPDIAVSSDTDTENPLMTDRFEYNADGRLAVLLRVYNSETNDVAAPVIRKTYSYDRSGKLVRITTEKNRITGSNVSRLQLELLQYTNTGLLYRKDVKTPDGAHYFLYRHDEKDRLKIEALFTSEGFAKYYCEYNYDSKDNVAWKEFFYPNSYTEAVSGWIEKYEYDRNPNPFRDMKLPVSSLFEGMDMISGNNQTRIANPLKTVSYKYTYEVSGYPILRIRVE